jgi:hypothetical protein
MTASSSLFVKLTGSENEYIKYPAMGLIELQEFGTTGSIIAAVFCEMNGGRLGAAVQVKNPQFEYSPEIASTGHDAVADLAQREREHDKSSNYKHTLIDSETKRVLGVFSRRMTCEIYAKRQGLRINTYQHTSGVEKVTALVDQSISTDKLADIYALFMANVSATETALISKIEALGVPERVAKQQADLMSLMVSP